MVNGPKSTNPYSGTMISVTALFRSAIAILAAMGLMQCNASALSPEIEVEQPMGTGLIDGVASIDFGSIGLGSSTTKSFTIRNVGTLPLTGLNATLNGSLSFAVSAISPTTLATGASLTFTVTFSSDSGLFGLRTTSLQIASNDGDENPFNIALSGIKLAPDIEIEQPTGTGLVDGISIIDFGIVPVG